MIKYVVTPLFVAVNNDLGIRPCSKYVPESFQLTLEFGEIIDFTVEDNPDGFLLVGHGLVTALKVDDGEPSKAEPDWPSYVIAFVIGTSVRNTVGHPLDILAEDRSSITKIVLSTDSTHND